MADQEKKAFELKNLEVSELEDEDLEGVSGGAAEPVLNGTCPTNNCPNTVAGCGAPAPGIPVNPSSS
jgi:hypothetical protein